MILGAPLHILFSLVSGISLLVSPTDELGSLHDLGCDEVLERFVLEGQERSQFTVRSIEEKLKALSPAGEQRLADRLTRPVRRTKLAQEAITKINEGSLTEIYRPSAAENTRLRDLLNADYPLILRKAKTHEVAMQLAERQDFEENTSEDIARYYWIYEYQRLKRQEALGGPRLAGVIIDEDTGFPYFAVEFLDGKPLVVEDPLRNNAWTMDESLVTQQVLEDFDTIVDQAYHTYGVYLHDAKLINFLVVNGRLRPVDVIPIPIDRVKSETRIQTLNESLFHSRSRLSDILIDQHILSPEEGSKLPKTFLEIMDSSSGLREKVSSLKAKTP